MTSSKWWMLIGLAGCGEQTGVSNEARVETAEAIANGRWCGDFLLDLARWYRELYTPASKDRVATVFADTIEAFGYEF